jgi:hypothetical protein
MSIVNLDKGLPLAERLQRLDHIQARRFSKLAGTVLEIATEGIIRHLAACDRMNVRVLPYCARGRPAGGRPLFC